MAHWSEIFPLIFFPFKIIVLAVGMFFAIKWHHDEGIRRGRKPTVSEHPPREPGDAKILEFPKPIAGESLKRDG